MRFRQSFSWGQVLVAPVWLITCYTWIRKAQTSLGVRSTYELTALAWSVILALNVFSQLFIWWDVDERGITERRLFSTRTIAWRELTRIGPWNTGKTQNRLYVEAEYHHPAPFSRSGRLLLRIEGGERRDLFARLSSLSPGTEVDPF